MDSLNNLKRKGKQMDKQSIKMEYKRNGQTFTFLANFVRLPLRGPSSGAFWRVGITLKLRFRRVGVGRTLPLGGACV